MAGKPRWRAIHVQDLLLSFVGMVRTWPARLHDAAEGPRREQTQQLRAWCPPEHHPALSPEEQHELRVPCHLHGAWMSALGEVVGKRVCYSHTPGSLPEEKAPHAAPSSSYIPTAWRRGDPHTVTGKSGLWPHHITAPSPDNAPGFLSFKNLGNTWKWRKRQVHAD